MAQFLFPKKEVYVKAMHVVCPACWRHFAMNVTIAEFNAHLADHTVEQALLWDLEMLAVLEDKREKD